MKEKSGPGKIEAQINQIHGNLDKMNKTIDDLSDATIAACVPKEPCDITELSPTPALDAPLVGALRDVNERIIILMQRIANINERLEL